MTYKWFQHLERGSEVAAIFFDFKKAFDTVPHFPLMSKLEKTGPDPHIYLDMDSQLPGRKAAESSHQWCIIMLITCPVRSATRLCAESSPLLDLHQ